ncbi:PAS domain S-box protein [Candidatus Albibeggiatoa sp. nov. NOAA]|uniref:PAS domain S-box protein n=1 Tax=Candidatus Albibeggiatoa sp. nov. NOAA TaxID=3162724 RepID=UPI0033039434|nr:PAS domain S-box protein [Thiotrichaceae bacterium]
MTRKSDDVQAMQQQIAALEAQVKQLATEKNDLEISLEMITAHADTVEAELLDARNNLEDQVTHRTQELAEKNILLETEMQERTRIQVLQRNNLIFLQALLNSIPNPIFYKDLNGYYLGCNHAYEQYLGVKKERLIGHVPSEFLPPEIAQQEIAIDAEIFTSLTPRVYESSLPFADGNIHQVICHKSVFHDADDSLAGMVGIMVDISERKHAEARLKVSEKRFRQLFEHAPIGIILVDSEGHFVQTNAMFQHICGYSAKEIKQLTYQNISCEREYEITKQQLTELQLGTRQSISDEKRLVHKEGHSIWCNIAAVPVHDEQGSFQYVIASIEDITARRQAEEALRKSEERFELAMKGANDGLWDWLINEGQLFLTDRWKEMLGYEHDELDNTIKQWYALIHPHDKDEMLSHIQAYLGKQQPSYEHTYRMQHKSGSYVWILDRGIAVWDEQTGQPYRMVGTHMDLTEQKEAEKALIEAKNAAEMANRSKTRFMANMSHELRTPLNAIIGYSEMLQEDLEEEGLEDLLPDLDYIHKAGENLLGIIGDILDITKIESGYMQVSYETFELAPIIGHILDAVHPVISENGNALHTQVQASLGKMYSCKIGLKQCLLNLLTNADKFTEQGQIWFSVSKVVRDETEWVLFEIRDTGIGIKAEQIEHLFKPFTQEDDSSTRKYGGTGLGLSITQFYSTKMGGVIEVESEVGQGSTFTLCIPTTVPEHLLEQI